MADLSKENNISTSIAPTKPASPVSSISTDQGKAVLGSAIDNHNKDIANLNTSTKQLTPEEQTAKGYKYNIYTGESLSGGASQNKNPNGLSYDEAKSLGVDLNSAAYDPATNTYTPSNTPANPQQDQINNIQAGLDADKREIESAFTTQVGNMDAAGQALINSIMGIYNSRMDALTETNKRGLASYSTFGIRGGTGRYAGEVQQGILNSEERAGLQRLQGLAAEEANKVSEANNALNDKKYSLFLNKRNELEKVRSDRQKQLSDLQDRALAAQKDQRDFEYKAKQDALAYKLTSDRFTYQQKQDAIDNAFKSGQISEAKRHNLAMEAIQKEPTPKEKQVAAAALKNAQASIPVMQDKIATINGLKDAPGLQTRVGTNILARTPNGFWGGVGKASTIVGAGLMLAKDLPDKLSGAGQDFAASIHKVTNGLTLQNLIDSKAQGATFGALSDSELQLLASSATRLSDWEIKDKNGVGKGIWNIDENSFKRELDNINKLTARALVMSGQSLLNNSEESDLSQTFGSQQESAGDPSAYY